MLPALLCLWLIAAPERVSAAVGTDTLRFEVVDVERTQVDFGLARPSVSDTLRFRIADAERRLMRVPRVEPLMADTALYAASAPLLSTDSLLATLPATRDAFRRDWFVYARGAVHTFQGDYSSLGKFSGTISPEVSLGAGYWFSPWIGVSVEFTRSESRGYTSHITDFGFGYGDLMFTPGGVPYRRMKTKWWSATAGVRFNLTRLFSFYEGYASRRNMNVFLLSGGFGAIRHLAYRQMFGNGYLACGYAELSYSRYFTRSRRVSLDFGFRWLMAHTNFDFDSKRHDKAIHRIDSNLALGLGVTCYLGRFRKAERPEAVIESYKTEF